MQRFIAVFSIPLFSRSFFLYRIVLRTVSLCCAWPPRPGLRGGEWGDATLLRPKIDQNQLQFGANFLQELQALSSLQSSKIVAGVRFCQCNCFLTEETDSWCFLLTSFSESVFVNQRVWRWHDCFLPPAFSFV